MLKNSIKQNIFIILIAILPTTYAQSAPNNEKVTLNNFECVKEFKSQIEILGRGPNYPEFIAKDITEELVKQDKESKLISATCMSEVELGIKALDIKSDGKNARAINYLEATFPLELVVFNGEENWILDAAIKYEVDGLVSNDIPTLTKRFTVNNSYDMNRVKLKELPIRYKEN